jgi:hypothetical protein
MAHMAHQIHPSQTDPLEVGRPPWKKTPGLR